MTILNLANQNFMCEVILNQKRYLERMKMIKPINELKQDMDEALSPPPFHRALESEEDVKVICEYKSASPSQNQISSVFLEDALRVFEEAGASAISILTEEKFFNGCLDYLHISSVLTNIPLLRKDFIIDEYQIYEAKYAGASAVLLLASLYPDLKRGIELCQELDLEAVVECHNREDIEKALSSQAKIIGINNRNFHDFSIDLNRTRRLAKHVPSDRILVAESGVKDVEDAKLLASYGADALLIGTSIMNTDMPQEILNNALAMVAAVKGARIER